MKYLIHLFLFLGFSAFAFSCGKSEQEIIPPDKMRDLLVDVHISEGLVEMDYSTYNSNERKEQVRKSVLDKYGVSQAQFDSSLVWYGKNLDDYVKIYDQVIEQLKTRDEAVKKLIAEDKMQTLTRPGDTVNIWKKESTYLLQPALLQGVLAFDVDVDENFNAGDKFTLRFQVRAFPQYRSLPLRMYLAVEQTNDSIHSASSEVNRNGVAELTVTADPANPIRQVFGYVSVPVQSSDNQQDVYLDHIELIRIHQNSQSTEVTPAE